MTWLGKHTFVLQAEDENDDSDDAEVGDADEEPESNVHVRACWIPLLNMFPILSHALFSRFSGCFDYAGWTVGCYNIVICRLTMSPQDE